MSAVGGVRSDGRTLVVGVITVAMILAFNRGAPALMRWQHDAIRTTRFELQRRREDVALARRLPVLRAQWRRTGELKVQLDSAEIVASTPVAAGSRLMSVISDLAQDAGVEVNSVRLIERDSPHEQSHSAIVSVQLTGGLEDAIVFVSTLEAGPPAATVTDFSIAPAADPVSAGEPRTLQVAMTVEAPVRRRAP